MIAMIRVLDESMAVAPQITPADLPAIKAAGYGTIVNNRPDGEEPGQPDDAQMRAAAEAAGLAYRYIPVTTGGFRPDAVAAMADAIVEADAPVLAYCRSGTRSCYLWAVASARIGADDAASLQAKARAAGYDLSPLMGVLELWARGE